MTPLPLDQSFNDTQRRILDAAVECVRQWGIDKTSLNDIAKQARVTRPTVYRYFSSRNEVLTTAMLQSGVNLGRRMMAHIDSFEDPADRFIEALLFALAEFPKEPYLGIILQTDLNSYVSQDAMNNAQGWDLSMMLTREILRDVDIPEADLEEITEVTIRMILSLLLMKGPKPRPPEDWRAFLTRRLLPMLGLDHYPRKPGH